MNQRLINWAIVSVMALAFGFVIVVAYWQLAPYNIVTGDAEFTIYNPGNVVEAGGYLEYGRNWCKTTDVDAVVSRAFVDGIRFEAPVVQPHYPKGCSRTIVLVQIPYNLPPGAYKMQETAIYPVAPWRWKPYDVWTPFFQVVPRNRVMRFP